MTARQAAAMLIRAPFMVPLMLLAILFSLAGAALLGVWECLDTLLPGFERED